MEERDLDEILSYLDTVKSRIENGESLAVFLAEIPADPSDLSVALLSVEQQDLFEFIGTLEFLKSIVLEGIHEGLSK